jgi:hypothetical protein
MDSRASKSCAGSRLRFDAIAWVLTGDSAIAAEEEHRPRDLPVRAEAIIDAVRALCRRRVR